MAIQRSRSGAPSSQRLTLGVPWILHMLLLPRRSFASSREGPASWRGAPTAKFQVAAKHLHDSSCFTEGFSFVNNSGDEVVESCGLTGRSFIRRYDLRTGSTLQQQSIPSDIFGEGITGFENRMYVLTYQHHQVLELDGDTWHLRARHPFQYGEGWGLTTDGCHLLATTGSSYIYRFLPEATGSWSLVHKVQVTYRGVPMTNLNELEYVTPKVWVNIWKTDIIWRVDPYTGTAELKVVVGKLYSWFGESTPNGIAYSTAYNSQLLLVTGKSWPEIFALHLSTEDLCGPTIAQVPGSCPKAPRSACWRTLAASHVQQPSPAPQKAALPEAKVLAKPVPLPSRGPVPVSFTVVATLLAAILLAAAILLPMGIRRYRYTHVPQSDEGITGKP